MKYFLHILSILYLNFSCNNAVCPVMCEGWRFTQKWEEHLYDCIILHRMEVWVHKTSLIPPFFLLKCLYQARTKSGPIFVCLGYQYCPFLWLWDCLWYRYCPFLWLCDCLGYRYCPFMWLWDCLCYQYCPFLWLWDCLGYRYCPFCDCGTA